MVAKPNNADGVIPSRRRWGYATERLRQAFPTMNDPALDQQQAAAAEQFERQSDRYGKSHILADTADLAAGLGGLNPSADATALDVATGGGHAAVYLARRGWRVT